MRSGNFKTHSRNASAARRFNGIPDVFVVNAQHPQIPPNHLPETTANEDCPHGTNLHVYGPRAGETWLFLNFVTFRPSACLCLPFHAIRLNVLQCDLLEEHSTEDGQ